MLTRRLLIVCALVLVAAPAGAKKVSRKGFPSTVTVGGEKLVLNGVGMREATMFKVDVYRGALYLPAKSSDAKAILSQETAFMIDMKFLREVEKDKLTGAWTDGFNIGTR